VKRIRRFIQEAVSELRKVSWPTFEQTRTLTVLVFAVAMAVGVYVLFWDTLFQTAVGFLARSLG
jgi:preprotein translocase SecE subunit